MIIPMLTGRFSILTGISDPKRVRWFVSEFQQHPNPTLPALEDRIGFSAIFRDRKNLANSRRVLANSSHTKAASTGLGMSLVQPQRE